MIPHLQREESNIIYYIFSYLKPQPSTKKSHLQSAIFIDSSYIHFFHLLATMNKLTITTLLLVIMAAASLATSRRRPTEQASQANVMTTPIPNMGRSNQSEKQQTRQGNKRQRYGNRRQQSGSRRGGRGMKRNGETTPMTSVQAPTTARTTQVPVTARATQAPVSIYYSTSSSITSEHKSPNGVQTIEKNDSFSFKYFSSNV